MLFGVLPSAQALKPVNSLPTGCHGGVREGNSNPESFSVNSEAQALNPVCAALQAFAAGLGSAPTTVLRLDNMVKAITLLDEQERTDVRPKPSSSSTPASRRQLAPRRGRPLADVGFTRQTTGGLTALPRCGWAGLCNEGLRLWDASRAKTCVTEIGRGHLRPEQIPLSG